MAQTYRRSFYGLGAFQAFIGVGAVAGGLGLTLDPSGASLGMSTDWLQGAPFPNFLIPGLFLLVVNGVCTLIGSALSFRRSRYAGEAAALLGAIMMAWIAIQVSIVSGSAGISWLQPFYFLVGLIESAWGLWLRRVAMTPAPG